MHPNSGSEDDTVTSDRGFIIVHNNPNATELGLHSQEVNSEESFAYFIFAFIPRQIYNGIYSGVDTISDGVRAGVTNTGIYASEKTAEFLLNRIRNWIENAEFDGHEYLLEILDANVLKLHDSRELDLKSLTNLPYVFPANAYERTAHLILSRVPEKLASLAVISLPPVVPTIVNYAIGANQNTVVPVTMLITGAGVYCEYFPPAAFALQKDAAINMIRELWQNTSMFERAVARMDKNTLAPIFKKILEELVKIYSEEVPPPAECILNTTSDLIANNLLQIQEIQVEEFSDVVLKTREEIIKELHEQIKSKYIESCALKIFAEHESKRIHNLIKTLGAKLSVGNPGSPESISFDTMLATFANLVPTAIENYILTKGNTEISAKKKIENALKIAEHLGIELKEPTYIELTLASFWLERPDISMLLDQLLNQCSFTGPLFERADKIKELLKSSSRTGCQNLTWVYAKARKVTADNKHLIGAAAASLPMLYMAMQQLNNSTEDQYLSPNGTCLMGPNF